MRERLAREHGECAFAIETTDAREAEVPRGDYETGKAERHWGFGGLLPSAGGCTDGGGTLFVVRRVGLEQELRGGIIVVAVLSQLRTSRYGYELRQSLAAQGLPVGEVARRAGDGTLAALPGIGPVTAQVMAEAAAGAEPSYLTRRVPLAN
jgi:hypothetical protein